MFDWLKEIFYSKNKGQKASDMMMPYPTINFLIEDPTMPQLVRNMKIPSDPQILPITIDGLNRSRPDLNPQAIHCLVTLDTAIGCFNKPVAAMNKQLGRWAASSNLLIVPLAGQDFNAYYDREALRFFYATDPVTRKMVYAANSTDVIAHETGHAFLDILRSDFWSVQALEIWAFHEAFGDINALVTVMQFDEAIQLALEETKGNLRQSNSLSRLAKELGAAIYHLMRGQKGYMPDCLRNVVNTFKYVDPSSLPPQAASDTQLAAECHSFGRIFAGAWWDIVCGIYEKEVATGIAPLQAAKNARDKAYAYTVEAACQAPRVVKFHDAVCRSMLIIDKAQGGTYQDILLKVFQDRNLLLQKPISAMSAMSFADLSEKLPGGKAAIFSHGMVATKRENRVIKLTDMPGNAGIAALSVNGIDLSNVELEVPADQYYEFDMTGNLVYEMVPDDEEIAAAARRCVTSIQSSAHVGDEEHHMWKVENGRLIRRHMV